MTDELTDLNGEWAWTQVEAFADGSLEGVALERMQRALESDPRLRRAVARARSVRRELGLLPKHGPSMAFLLRLLQTPPADPGARRQRIAIPAVGALAAAAIVAGISLWIGSGPAPKPTDAQTAAALQQLELAVHYMRKSAAIAHEELNAAVGHGLREALTVSRESVRDRGQENGG
jgi:hypothetical protein